MCPGWGSVCEGPEVVLDAFHSWGRLEVEGTGASWLRYDLLLVSPLELDHVQLRGIVLW